MSVIWSIILKGCFHFNRNSIQFTFCVHWKYNPICSASIPAYWILKHCQRHNKPDSFPKHLHKSKIQQAINNIPSNYSLSCNQTIVAKMLVSSCVSYQRGLATALPYITFNNINIPINIINNLWLGTFLLQDQVY